MAVVVMATTVDLARGFGTLGTPNTNVIHTPTTLVAVDDNTANTGRTTSSTQSFLSHMHVNH